MKHYIAYAFIMVVVAFAAGCSSAPVKNDKQILAEVAALFGEGSKDFDYIAIPSHGAIGDGMAIAAGGGANAKNLRRHLQQRSSNGEGKVVVTSRNSALANAVIKGAVSDNQFPGVWLVYAGDAKYAESLKQIVEAAGMKYGFVDINQSHQR